MKNNTQQARKAPRKLRVNAETVRNLSTGDLRHVAGGRNPGGYSSPVCSVGQLVGGCMD